MPSLLHEGRDPPAARQGLARGGAKGLAGGEVDGRAKIILQVLAARGLEASAEIRDQVLACTDIAQLDEWGGKAATAQSVEEVFGEGSDKL